MNWIRAPEGGQVLFGDVVSRHDCGGRADDLTVLDVLPARKVVNPAMDLGQLGAHGGSKALFPEVGDVLLVLAALGGAVSRQGGEEDLSVVVPRSQEGDGDIENFPEGGPVS